MKQTEYSDTIKHRNIMARENRFKCAQCKNTFVIFWGSQRWGYASGRDFGSKRRFFCSYRCMRQWENAQQLAEILGTGHGTKLTSADVEMINAKYQRGISKRELCNEYHLTFKRVCSILGVDPLHADWD